MKKVNQPYHLKWLFIPALLGLFFIISFCKNEKQRQLVNEFSAWVKEHKDSADTFIDDEWANVEREFEEKKAELDKGVSEMDVNMKATYERSVNDWKEFKNEYFIKKEQNLSLSQMNKLRESLVHDGIHPDLSNVGAANVVDVYTYFVKRVDQNKDVYTKAEWNFVNDRWKELNAIKDQLDEQHSLTPLKQREILAWRTKYSGIKALNKPFAE